MTEINNSINEEKINNSINEEKINNSINEEKIKYNIDILSKQDLLMRSLSKYYHGDEKIQKILPIINGKSNISLRILDWFVTNYSKKNNIIYKINNIDSDNYKQFIVYLNYKSQLKAYSKKQFDPFCRRDRILFIYSKESTENNNDNSIVTTVGQLNFFRWALQNNIINYVKSNLKEIEHDMNSSIKDHSREKRKNNIKKRRELSRSATRTVNIHESDTILEFS